MNRIKRTIKKMKGVREESSWLYFDRSFNYMYFLLHVQNVTAESLLLQLKEGIVCWHCYVVNRYVILLSYPVAINEIVPAYVNKYNEDMAEYELALKAEQVHNYIHVHVV